MIFELLFLLFVLATVLALIATIVLHMSRRHKVAYRTMVATAAAWVAYLAIVAAVSASTPQRVLGMNEDLCFDEICFAAVDFRVAPQLGPADRPTKASGIFSIVTVRVSSHSRGRTQSEGGLRARLWDGARYYDASAVGQQAYLASGASSAPLTARLSPGETVQSIQVFDMPLQVPSLQLVLDHGFTPGYFVIGESPLFHQPTVIKLALPKSFG
jgi:hypothetical protein